MRSRPALGPTEPPIQWIPEALKLKEPIRKLYTEPGARGSIVVKALCYKPEGRGFDTRCGDFLNLPNLQATLGPGVHSASNRNEYRKHKKIMFLSKVRRVRRADNLTAICEPIVQTMWDL
jgi:hypothetical protein